MSAWRGFQLFAAVLVVLAMAGWLFERRVSHGAARSTWRAAADHRTWVAVPGPDPRSLVGAPNGEAIYYGPLSAGDCLPPIDLTRVRPFFNFHGFGARLDLGHETADGFSVLASATQLPPELPPNVTHVQVCFPSGIEHEQVLVVAGAGPTGHAFRPGSTLVPPPLRREPLRMDLELTGSARGIVSAHGTTIFALAGVELQVAIDGPSGIVIELGEFGKNWQFEVKETVHIAAGEHRRLERVRQWSYARVLLPDGGSAGYLTRAAAQG